MTSSENPNQIKAPARGAPGVPPSQRAPSKQLRLANLKLRWSDYLVSWAKQWRQLWKEILAAFSVKLSQKTWWKKEKAWMLVDGVNLPYTVQFLAKNLTTPGIKLCAWNLSENQILKRIKSRSFWKKTIKLRVFKDQMLWWGRCKWWCSTMSSK